MTLTNISGCSEGAGLPSACLHPVHLLPPDEVTGGPRPFTSAEVRQLLTIKIASSSSSDKLKVDSISGFNLVLAGGVCLSLFLADLKVVQFAASPGKIGVWIRALPDQQALASPQQRNANPHWLLVINGGATEAEIYVRRMATAGAIRPELSKSGFTLSATKLGSGGQASVFLATDKAAREDGTYSEGTKSMAVRIMKDATESNRIKSTLKAEIETLVLVQNHPNIVRYMGLVLIPQVEPEKTTHWAILTEYCSGGDLCEAVSANPWPEWRAQSMMKGIFEAVAYVHSLEIVHRDIKCENVLISKDGAAEKLILTDFGTACKTTDPKRMLERPGSIGYAAPELLMHKPYTELVDMFGTGSTLYKVICGRNAFGRSHDNKMLNTWLGKPDLQNPFYLQATPECRELIASLLLSDPSARLTSGQAVAHVWVSGLVDVPVIAPPGRPAEGRPTDSQVPAPPNNSVTGRRVEVQKRGWRAAFGWAFNKGGNSGDSESSSARSSAGSCLMLQREASSADNSRQLPGEDRSLANRAPEGPRNGGDPPVQLWGLHARAENFQGDSFGSNEARGNIDMPSARQAGPPKDPAPARAGATTAQSGPPAQAKMDGILPTGATPQPNPHASSWRFSLWMLCRLFSRRERIAPAAP